MKATGLRPDSPAWLWARRALLSCALLLLVWAGVRGQARGDLVPGEPAWLAVLGALLLAVAWLPRPSLWALVFVAAFTVLKITTVDYNGAAWFAVYAVCIDVNSRRPARLGLLASGVLAAAQLWPTSADSAGSTAGGVLYLVALTLLGQFIRIAFAGARAEREKAVLEVQLERSNLARAVHDTGAARLTQVLMVARHLNQDASLDPRARAQVQMIVDCAQAGSDELRAVINPAGDIARRSNAGETLDAEWERSVAMLQSAGFDVAATSPPIGPVTPLIEQEAVRAILEASANICRHARHPGRVAATITLSEEGLTMKWLNDSPQTAPNDTLGMGLAGMRDRIHDLGGAVDATSPDDGFCLIVHLPATPTTTRASHA